MDIAIGIIAAILGAIGIAISIVKFAMSDDDTPMWPIVSSLIPSATLWSWFIYGYNQPLEIDYKTYHEIQTINLPSGGKKQIYTKDNGIYDVGFVFASPEQVVELTYYKKWYGGIYWSEFKRRDFKLVKRDIYINHLIETDGRDTVRTKAETAESVIAKKERAELAPTPAPKAKPRDKFKADDKVIVSGNREHFGKTGTITSITTWRGYEPSCKVVFDGGEGFDFHPTELSFRD